MRGSTMNQGKQHTHVKGKREVWTLLWRSSFSVNSVLSLGKVEQENPTSSRSWWHKHRKVFTSSGERTWSVIITCLRDASACLVGMGTAVFLPFFILTSWWWALQWCLDWAVVCLKFWAFFFFLGYRVRIGLFQVYWNNVIRSKTRFK